MELACKYEEQMWLNEKKYTCVILSASITEPETIIKAIIGIHQPGRTDSDVEAIKFEYTTVHYFPRGLRQIYRSVDALQINKCGLKEISAEDLEGHETVVTLFLGYNHLSSIPSDLFKNMNSLRSFSFYNNEIEFMSSELIVPLIRNPLHYANFRKNTSIDALYDPPNKYSVRTARELMDLIDNSCRMPTLEITKADRVSSNEKFVEGFKDLWMTGRLSDFTIVVGSKLFHVHRSVLSVRSSVFGAIFESEMQERKENQMTIEDFSQEAVEDFLYYLYTGEVASEFNAMELFALASKYDVTFLRASAEKVVLANLDGSNALEVLSLGNLYQSEEMIENSFAEIKLEIDFIDNLKTKPAAVIEITEAKRSRDGKIEEANKEYERIIERIRHEQSISEFCNEKFMNKD